MKIKFCGFRRIEDVKFALSLGVDLIGFIFFKGSKRFISPEEFVNISREVKGNFVGVFVDEDIEKVYNTYKTYDLYAVQLHGNEDEDYVKKLSSQDIKIIKAFRLKDKDSVDIINSYPSEYVLVDAYVEGNYGGTGKQINLDLLDYLFTKIKTKKIFLSGGINKDNISRIIKLFGRYLYGIDLSSGIEESPGIKNHKLMRETYDTFKSCLNQLNI
ncbi:MAG: phosphoribosylanthranilate isomerase [Brevinematales bacterium]|nr:phosphoribosylanthranilate isomerase [Brevinematales bacterium]